MTASLEGLPVDLLDRVVHYVPRPADLKSLCFTSKTLRDTALPKLYRLVELHRPRPACWPDMQMGRGLLSAGNAGLPYIRKLYCDSSGVTYRTLEAASIHRLLQSLPRDCLRCFGSMDIPMDQATVSMLLTQQTKLEYLSLGPLAFDLNPLLEADGLGDKVWTNLEELVIPRTVGSEQDLTAYGNIIRKSPKLAVLHIWCNSIDGTQTRLKVTAAQNLVFEKLFLQQEGNAAELQQLELEKLSLDSVCLVTPPSRFLQIFNVHALQTLEIECCNGCWDLLPVLSDALTRYGSSIRNFHLTTYFIRHEPVEQFLRSTKRLKSLQIVGDGCDGLVAKDAFQGHLGTLEELVVVYNFSEASSSDGDYLQLYETVTKLPFVRKLAIALPKVDLLGHSDEQLKHYVDTLQSLLSIPTLDLLRIVSWPSMASGSFADPPLNSLRPSFNKVNRAFYMHSMDAFMAVHLSKAFRAAGCSTGSQVVYFGSWCADNISDGEVDVSVAPVYYAPTKQVDVFGNLHTNASKVDSIEAKYILDQGAQPNLHPTAV